MTDFYVGYADPPPPRIRRTQRLVTAASLLLAVLAATVVALGQRRLPAATFEFGAVRTFEGLLVADPYPSLIVRGTAGPHRYLLTGPGKSGAEDHVRGFVGQAVTLEGTQAMREGASVAMIEVQPGSVAAAGAGGGGRSGVQTDLGNRYLEGEIVGSKCYLGVMNPGSGVAHRACATSCIRSGIPPLLSVRRVGGRSEGLILAGPEGEAIGDRLAGLIARPVGVRGRVIRRDGATIFQVDPAAIEKLAPCDECEPQ